MSDSNTAAPHLLSTDQLAKRWGVIPLTIYHWERDGVIPPSVRIGKVRKYFRLEDVEAYEQRSNNQLPVQLLHGDAKPPYRATPASAGLDLHAAESVTIDPGCRVMVPTGLAVAIPYGHAGFIWPRSGLAVKHGIDTLAGVIDADYRGEIKVALINHGQADIEIEVGDRIAQLLIQPVATLDPIETKVLSETVRGQGGFGSSGK